MTFHTFSVGQASYNFTLTWEEYYRSENSHEIVKHCFEFRWLSGPGYHEIGFATTNHSRVFTGFYQYVNESHFLFADFRTDPAIIHHEVLGWKGEMNEDLMVCLDSLNHLVTLIKANQKYFYRHNIQNEDLWYAYLDHGEIKPDFVSINLGYNPFRNQLPFGYSPWVSFNCKRIFKTCKTLLNFHLSLFILIPLFI